MSQFKHGLIVVGAGMAGLSAAIAWSKVAGRNESVLVLEKRPIPGGCVGTFAREGYRFDTVQLMPRMDDLLDWLGANLPLRRFDGTMSRLYLAGASGGTAAVHDIPAGRHAFEAMLVGKYPHEAKRIRRYLRLGDRLMDELRHLYTEPTILQGMGILARCPGVLALSGRSFGKILKSSGFKDEELLEILNLFSSFSGVPASRCASLLTMLAMMSTLEGCYRPKGGFIELPAAMAKRLKDAGGILRYGAEVTGFLIESGRIRGVRIGSEEILSDRVICSADTFTSMTRLLTPGELERRPPRSLRRYLRRFHRTRPSPSVITVHLGLAEGEEPANHGLDGALNVLTTGRSGQEGLFADWERADNDGNSRDFTAIYPHTNDRFHMILYSPSSSIGGKPTLCIQLTPVPGAPWIRLRDTDRESYDEAKRMAAEFVVAQVERFIWPGFSAAIRFTDVSTPATYARFLANGHGGTNDMLATPENYGMSRLPARTPVEGFFLPKFSHGILPSVTSGLQVVDMLTGGSVMGGRARFSSSAAREGVSP